MKIKTEKLFQLFIGTMLFLSLVLYCRTVSARSNFKYEIIDEHAVQTTTSHIIPECDPYTLELNYDNFMAVCEYYGIEYPEIVYAQARIESGNFKSNLYNRQNNFLGLYNSNREEFYSFNHWSDCLKGYRDLVQVKYIGGDYYQFLEELPYATDKDYISKIKQIVN